MRQRYIVSRNTISKAVRTATELKRIRVYDKVADKVVIHFEWVSFESELLSVRFTACASL